MLSIYMNFLFECVQCIFCVNTAIQNGWLVNLSNDEWEMINFLGFLNLSSQSDDLWPICQLYDGHAKTIILQT